MASLVERRLVELAGRFKPKPAVYPLAGQGNRIAIPVGLAGLDSIAELPDGDLQAVDRLFSVVCQWTDCLLRARDMRRAGDADAANHYFDHASRLYLSIEGGA